MIVHLFYKPINFLLLLFFFVILAKDQLDLILDAFEAYKNYTCIEFIPRTNEKDYINIIYGSG